MFLQSASVRHLFICEGACGGRPAGPLDELPFIDFHQLRPEVSITRHVLKMAATKRGEHQKISLQNLERDLNTLYNTLSKRHLHHIQCIIDLLFMSRSCFQTHHLQLAGNQVKGLSACQRLRHTLSYALTCYSRWRMCCSERILTHINPATCLDEITNQLFSGNAFPCFIASVYLICVAQALKLCK